MKDEYNQSMINSLSLKLNFKTKAYNLNFASMGSWQWK
jgi:hypothetical protein